MSYSGYQTEGQTSELDHEKAVIAREEARLERYCQRGGAPAIKVKPWAKAHKIDLTLPAEGAPKAAQAVPQQTTGAPQKPLGPEAQELATKLGITDAKAAGKILGECDPAILKGLDLGQVLGANKNEFVGQALLQISTKTKAGAGTAVNRQNNLDPALFEHLASQIDEKTWNDAAPGLGRKRGLAPLVCNRLWNTGHYDEICKLVDLKVDTSLPFNLDEDTTEASRGEGVWSGFVQPLQHVLGNYVRNVGELEGFEKQGKKGDQPRFSKLSPKTEAPPDLKKVEGARKILSKLGDNASVLTKWEEIKQSDLLKKFKEEPGTIWGFENVRMPYVQAAHETDEGNQPLRMWELWDTVEEEALKPEGYEKLMSDPEKAIPYFVGKAIQKFTSAPSDKVHREFSATELQQKHAAVKVAQDTAKEFDEKAKASEQKAEENEKNKGEAEQAGKEIKVINRYARDAKLDRANAEQFRKKAGESRVAAQKFQAEIEQAGEQTPEKMTKNLELEAAKLNEQAKSLEETGDADSAEEARNLRALAQQKQAEAAFIANFESSAANYLRVFSEQMPRGTFAGLALDKQGNKRKGTKKDQDLTITEIAGMEPGKFMGALGCKVGLWWAKDQGEPVYYCLDGVNPKDFIEYKKVKNAAVSSYLNGEPNTVPHADVITLVEIREIMKNWEELKDTVRFTRKGELLSGSNFDKEVAEWRAKMKEADEEAKKIAAAPPKTAFTDQLNKIDPGLLAKIPDSAEGNRDARSIVRKTGYLAKISNTRPSIVLKYLMSKCAVLMKPEYGLVPDASKIVGCAQQVRYLSGIGPSKELTEATEKLVGLLGTVNQAFREPLRNALSKIPEEVAKRKVS